MALRMSATPSCDAGTENRWACVRTKPKAEFWARDNLERVGFTTYLPMAAVRRRDRRTGRYSMVQAPLFSNYMFLQHEVGSSWRGVRGCPGVLTLLLDGPRPAYVKVGAVEMLQATEEVRRDPAPAPVWARGMACTVNQGAFHGHDGVIVETRGASDAVVGLFLFGALRDVTLPLSNLQPRAN
jgi:transcription antitermination factor NusG